MKKFAARALSLTFAIAAGVASANAHARSWTEIQKSGSLKAATEGTFPPFNEYKGSKLTGFEVELVEDIAAALKLKVEWKTLPFDSLLIGLGQDRYDLVASSHGITPERSRVVDFTDPHYCTGGVIYSKAGGPLKVEDLAGKTVAVQVGTTYVTRLRQVKGIKDVKTYPKDTDSLQNLLAGRVDAWVTDRFVGLEGIKVNPAAGIRSGETLFQERVAMAVSKGNRELNERINRALGELMKNGTYAALSKKYFGEDIRCR